MSDAEKITELRAMLEKTRDAMVMLAALAGSHYNQGIPWAKINGECRELLQRTT